MRHTVLVVEDEEELRDMLREALELNGYAVRAVEDGQQALDALAAIEHVCVVLLDLVLPNMNGWEFFAKLRERPEYARIPVVVHSSAPDRAPAGVDGVLRKPLSLANLLAVVKRHCVEA